MNDTRWKAMQYLQNPPSPWLLIPTLLITSIGCAAIWQFILIFIDEESSMQMGITAIVAWILVTALYCYYLYILQPTAKQIEVLDHRPPAPRKGLIFFMGKASPCEAAINYHLPALQKCWLIYDDDSRADMEQVVQTYAGKNPQIKPVFIERNSDLPSQLDPGVFAAKVDWIYVSDSEDLMDNEIITDYTGMSKNATAGAVLACLGRPRPIQYMQRASNEDTTVLPCEIVMDYREIRVLGKTLS